MNYKVISSRKIMQKLAIHFVLLALYIAMSALPKSALAIDLESSDSNTHKVIIEVQFKRDGIIEKASIVESSGIQSIDDLAIETIKKIDKIPPLPASTLPEKQNFTIRIPIILRDSP